jgi:hypothetical protein
MMLIVVLEAGDTSNETDIKLGGWTGGEAGIVEPRCWL